MSQVVSGPVARDSRRHAVERDSPRDPMQRHPPRPVGMASVRRRFGPAQAPISLFASPVGLDQDDGIRRVLAAGPIRQGPQVDAFEREFGRQFALNRPCVAVNSGTAALHLGMLAARIGRGDEVIVPSFAPPAVATAVALTGATPTFADIDPYTFGLDPRSVRAQITPRTVAVVAVHLFGHPATMPALRRIAGRHGLMLIEDASHAHGAGIAGRPVGSFGTLAAFSLGPTANLTTGEGGMVATQVADLHRRVWMGRDRNITDGDDAPIVIGNVRMTDIQAAVGRAQLTRISTANRRRVENATFLSRHLRGVRTPPVRTGYFPVFQQYVIRVERDRDRLRNVLRDRYGIETAVPVGWPVHRRRPFQARVHLPETDRAARECLSLPVHPGLSRLDLERIVRAVNSLATTLG